ncbi:MAG: hypothetical protein Q4G59_11075 [Planctomycetia bacterium]|nr:hypothetical protein [Planctomycetia bacterium]
MYGGGIFFICMSLVLLVGSIWGIFCLLIWCNNRWKILPEGIASIVSVLVVTLITILLAVFLTKYASNKPTVADGPYVTVFEMSLFNNALFIKVFCIFAFMITVWVGLFYGFFKEYRKPTRKENSKEQSLLGMVLAVLMGGVGFVVMCCLFGMIFMDDLAGLRQFQAGNCFVAEGQAHVEHVRTGTREPYDIVRVDSVKFKVRSGEFTLSFSPPMSLGNTKGNTITEGLPVRIHYYQSIQSVAENKIAKIEVKTDAASNGLHDSGSWESQKKKLAIPRDTKTETPSNAN